MKYSIIFLSLFYCLNLSAEQAEESVSSRELGVSQEPLATMGDVVLTQGEIDAAFSKIPEDIRLTFIRDGKKVEALVRNLLTNKALAAEALKIGYQQNTLVSLRVEQARESALAQEWIKKVTDDAPDGDYEAIAQEKYLVNPGQWKTQDRIDVSHILISSEIRPVEAAEKIATELWQELEQDPGRFDAMVTEYSDDPSSAANGGRFPDVKRDDMVEAFQAVAFSLESPGEISAPVVTEYGVHIIRLNKKIPGTVPAFEEIREKAVYEARVEYLEEYRNKYMRNLLSNPIVLSDGAAEAMAKRYFGENLELAPDYSD